MSGTLFRSMTMIAAWFDTAVEDRCRSLDTNNLKFELVLLKMNLQQKAIYQAI